MSVADGSDQKSQYQMKLSEMRRKTKISTANVEMLEQ